MDFKVLAIGDITGERGVDHLRRHLRALKKEKSVDFVVANGENAAGTPALLPAHAEEIFAAGAGCHRSGRPRLWQDADRRLFRGEPLYSPPCQFYRPGPGPGLGCVRPGPGAGGCAGHQSHCNTWISTPKIPSPPLTASSNSPDHHYLVELHAPGHQREAGPVVLFWMAAFSALWGTHTHVPTADERVLSQGHGLYHRPGHDRAHRVRAGHSPGANRWSFFLGGLPGRYQTAGGPCKMQGAIFTLDSNTGLCTGVERIEIR